MNQEQQKVYEGLMDFCEEHRQEDFFSGKQLADKMEPIFREQGFRNPMPKAASQHILVMRDDAAGDFVLCSPFLREVRRIYPASHITLWASARNAELAGCCPYINNLMVKDFEKEGGPFWEIFAMLAKYAVEELLPYHFDLGFSGRLGIKSINILLMYMAGVQSRVAFTQDREGDDGKVVRIGWDALLTVPVPLLQVIQSDVDRDLFMLEYLLQLPVADRHLELWTLASEKEAAVKAVAPLTSRPEIKRLYTVMPCTSEAFRQWPVERFTKLMKIIMEKEQDLGLVLMGSPGDAPRTEAIAAAFPGRAISLAGKLPFRVSAEVVGLTEKYIGDDTALMHIAAAHKVPVLTTFPYPAELGFRPMSVPIRFQPYQVPSVIVLPPKKAGQQCNRWHGPGCAVADKPHCILGITVEKMLEGYEMLEGCIREQRVGTLIMK